MTKLYYDDGLIQLYHGDSRNIPIPAQSVHCVVTSPPYWNLRVYHDLEPVVWNDGWVGCLGNEPTPEQYLEHLVRGTFAEIHRVLRSDGVLWVNLGDTRSGSGKGQMGNGSHAGNHGDKQHTNTGSVQGGLTTTYALSPLNRVGIPERFALMMQSEGWIWRDTIIWHKKSPMPESVAGTRWERCRVKIAKSERADGVYTAYATETPQSATRGPAKNYAVPQDGVWEDCPGCPKCQANGGLVLRKGSWRCTNAFEQIFMFVKSGDYWSDGAGVKQPNTQGTIDRLKSGPVQAISKGKAGKEFGHNGQSEMVVATGANRRNVWHDIKPEPYGGQHFATYPSMLPELCLLASTSQAGCCPMCGSQWARVIHRENMVIEGSGRSEESGIRIVSSGTVVSPATCETLEWLPICACPPHKPIPSTVLDPFGGTATTAVAAVRNGRTAICVDASLTYLSQAVQRIAKQLYTHK